MSTPRDRVVACRVVAGALLAGSRSRRAARPCPSPGRSTARPRTGPTGRRTRRTSTRRARPRTARPAAIVSGFLVAMQANPLSTSVARDVPLRARTRHLEAQPRHDRLRGVHGAADQRRRRRCGWPTPVASTPAAAGAAADPGSAETLDIRLVSENGQWRIDNPVNALVVPTSFFDRSFARFNLYFYDQTGRVAAARPGVHPARASRRPPTWSAACSPGPGERWPTSPARRCPSRTDLDLSVVVTESGVAEVPLSREVLQASPDELVPRGRPAGLDAAPGARASSASGSPSPARRCRCRAAASTRP